MLNHFLQQLQYWAGEAHVVFEGFTPKTSEHIYCPCSEIKKLLSLGLLMALTITHPPIMHFVILKLQQTLISPPVAQLA